MPATDEIRAARLGIDFGTSTTVAVVTLPGRGSRSLLFDGSPLLPSAICVDAGGRILVGRDALHTAMARPAAFEPHPKQRVDDGTVLLGDTEIAVSRLFGAVIDRVLLDAANVIAGATDRTLEVVVTCPASWGSTRRATLLAAAPPGARLVEEPVAAAHCFVDVAGKQIPEGGTAVVYDFGAGTFDAAVVRRTGDGFAVIASRGLPDCGGLDLDAAIVAHLAAAVPDPDAWHRLNEPVTAADRRARQLLWTNVRTAKEMLSRVTTSQVYLPLLDVDVPLGREEIDQLAAPILGRTVTTVHEVLDSAGVGVTELAAIFLCGGSSRMPAVGTHLHRAFGFAPLTVEQPELAVAEGSLRAIGTATDATTDATTEPTTDTVPDTTVAAAGGTAVLAVTTAMAAVGAEATTQTVPATGDRPSLTRAGGGTRWWGGRAWMSAAALLGVVALIATVLVVFSPGGNDPLASGPSPSVGPPATVSPSPSYPPGIDPCLLGTWRITSSQVYGEIDDQRVQYAGGAGVLTTYRADGTSFNDFNRSAARVVVVDGVTWSDVVRGTSFARYYAENGTITVTVTKSTAVGTLRRNGKFNARGSTGSFLEPSTYRCQGNILTSQSTAGNYSDVSVRVIPPSPKPSPSAAPSAG